MIRETTGTPSAGMTYPGLRTGGCYPATPSHVALMLLATPAQPAPLPPFTHQEFLKRHPFSTEIPRVAPRVPQFVQVKQGFHSVCACITDAWTAPDGTDLWNVVFLSPPGKRSVPVSRTVQCSGLDGRCTCAGERS